MAESPRHRKDADDASIVDSTPAHTPDNEEPPSELEPHDGEAGGERHRERRGDLADAADPAVPSGPRRARIGSAGGGTYSEHGSGSDRRSSDSTG